MTRKPEPEAPDSQPQDTAQPHGPESLKQMYAIVGAVGAVVIAGCFFWRGLDFALAALLGFVVVLLNFIWTKNLVKSILLEQHRPKALSVFVYIFKFGLTAVVLYIAMVKYQVDGLGILIGLSTMIVGTFIFAYYVKPDQPR